MRVRDNLYRNKKVLVHKETGERIPRVVERKPGKLKKIREKLKLAKK